MAFAKGNGSYDILRMFNHFDKIFPKRDPKFKLPRILQSEAGNSKTAQQQSQANHNPAMEEYNDLYLSSGYYPSPKQYTDSRYYNEPQLPYLYNDNIDEYLLPTLSLSN